MATNSNTRIEWIDMAKGVGIFLVIAGHTFAYSNCDFIYAFHMPLFFFLSGLVFNDKRYDTFKEITVKKGKQLLFPWIIIYAISLCVTLLIPMWRANMSLKSMLFELYTMNTNTINNSSIWYLVCLFFVFVLYYLFQIVLKKVDDKYVILILLVLGLALLYQRPIYKGVLVKYDRLPMKFDTALVGLMFFYSAFRFKGFWMRLLNSTNVLWLMFSVLLFAVGVYFNGASNLNSLEFGNIPLIWYPTAFAGIYSTVSLCVIISRLSGKIISWFKDFLKYYGVNSLVIFGFQSLFIRLYIQFFNTSQGLNMELYGDNPCIHQWGSFLVVSLICSPLIVLLFTKLRKHGIRII